MVSSLIAAVDMCTQYCSNASIYIDDPRIFICRWYASMLYMSQLVTAQSDGFIGLSPLNPLESRYNMLMIMLLLLSSCEIYTRMIMTQHINKFMSTCMLIPCMHVGCLMVLGIGLLSTAR